MAEPAKNTESDAVSLEPQAATTEPVHDITDSFVEALVEFCESEGKLKAKKTESVVRTDPVVNGDVYVVVPVTALTYRGSVAVAMDTAVFLLIANRLERRKDTKIDYNNIDSAVVIVSKILGLAGKKLKTFGHFFQQGSPMLFLGEKNKVHHLPTGKCVSVSFKSKVGYLCLEVMLKSRSGSGPNGDNPHQIVADKEANEKETPPEEEKV